VFKKGDYMEIDVSKLKHEFLNLNHLISEYEDIYLFIHENISSLSFSWNDANSLKFIDKNNDLKNKINLLVTQLKDLSNSYQYVCEVYSKIGNKIYFNFDGEDLIRQKFTLIIDKYNKIINDIETLKASNISLINNTNILLQLEQFKKNKDTLELKYKDFLNILEDIRTSEREINRLLSEIDIKNIMINNVGER
jgi:hypothetical protein